MLLLAPDLTFCCFFDSLVPPLEEILNLVQPKLFAPAMFLASASWSISSQYVGMLSMLARERGSKIFQRSSTVVFHVACCRGSITITQVTNISIRPSLFAWNLVISLNRPTNCCRWGSSQNAVRNLSRLGITPAIEVHAMTSLSWRTSSFELSSTSWSFSDSFVSDEELCKPSTIRV